MMFQFYFKKMGSSESLKHLSQKKLSDVIERHVGNHGTVRVTFLEEGSTHKILCNLQGWNGRVIHATAASDNMYAAIDVIAHKLEAQLMRLKPKIKRGLPPVRRLKLVRKPETEADEDYEASYDMVN